MYIDERGRVNRGPSINRWERVQRSTPPPPRRTPAPAPPGTRGRESIIKRFFSGLLGLIKFILRLILSPIVGVFIGGIIAAILDMNDIVRIEEGTPLFWVVVAVPTFFVWRFLSRVGPLKSRG